MTVRRCSVNREKCCVHIYVHLHIGRNLLLHVVKPCLSVMQRLAVYEACSLLKKYKKEYEALQEAMKGGASIAQCVRTIEEA